MAILKTANAKGKYYDEDARYDVVNYILYSDQAIRYCGCYGVNLIDIAESMDLVAAQYGKNSGVKLRHFIISFSPFEKVSPEKANEIGKVAASYFGREYQVVYSVHESADNLHIHIVINSVSYIDGHRYGGTKKEFYGFINYMERALQQFGIHSLRYVSDRSKTI